jgi:hypothetical protein
VSGAQAAASMAQAYLRAGSRPFGPPLSSSLRMAPSSAQLNSTIWGFGPTKWLYRTQVGRMRT